MIDVCEIAWMSTLESLLAVVNIRGLMGYVFELGYPEVHSSHFRSDEI